MRSGNNQRKRSWMKYVCHQRPERCFWIAGKPMVICSRCFGVYLGLLIGFILPVAFREILHLDIEITFGILIFSIIPMALDGFSQLIGLRTSNNKARFITGLLAGISLGIAFCWLLYHIIFS